MRRKLVALSGLLVVAGFAAVVAGPPLANSISSEPCAKPRLLLDTDKTNIIERVDAYFERVMTGPNPPYKATKLSDTDWEIGGAPVLEPGRVEIIAQVGEGWTFFGPLKADIFEITVVRDCAGGEWRVVKFKRQGNAKAE